MNEELTPVEELTQVQADAIFQSHQELCEGCEKPEIRVKNINEGIKNLNDIEKILAKEEDNEMKEKQMKAESDIKTKDLEFQKWKAEKEFEVREKEIQQRQKQAEDDLNFKKEQAEEEKKNRKVDIWIKIALCLIPIIITSIATVIYIKVTAKENRETLMVTLFANEVMERIGDISNVTPKDVTKEAFKQASQKVNFR